MAAVAILDLLGAYLDLSGLCRCAKYGWNRCSSFDNMRVSLFCALGLKTPIHAPKNRELGDKSGGTETFCSFIPLGIQYPSTRALQIKRRKNPLCRFGSRREQNFESQKGKLKTTRQWYVPCPRLVRSFWTLACGLYRRRNHPCQMLYRSVQGLRSSAPQFSCSPKA